MQKMMTENQSIIDDLYGLDVVKGNAQWGSEKELDDNALFMNTNLYIP